MEYMNPIIIVAFFVALVFAIVVFVRNRKLNASLDKIVKKRITDLESKDALLNTVNEVADVLLQSESDTFLEDLRRCLGMMAKAVDVDRAYIWKNNTIRGRLYCSRYFEWWKEDAPTYDMNMTVNVSYDEQIPGWERTLSDDECINEIVRNMSQAEQDQLVPQGILSIFIVPVFIRDEFWGFVGYNDCHAERLFDENEAMVLRSGGLLMANALLRNEMDTEIRDSAAELKSALEKAEQANKAKSAFLSTMSHEIRTPMNAILGITEIQLQNESLDNDLKEALDKIYSSGDMLLGIINDILDLSKIEAGKLELSLNKYEIASLVSDTAQLNMMRIGSKMIEFELNVDENTPVMLSGDELRVKQILNNLLSNAFKYTTEGLVKLNVSAEEIEGNSFGVILVLSVSDTGQGMTKEQVDKLFDEYSRFNMETNRSTEGTGLGMSITQNLIWLMNGEILIESEPNVGSTFTVRITQGRIGTDVLGKEMAENLHQFRTSSRTQMKRVQINREPMPYGRVLIVDDVETNIYVARGLLAPYRLNIDSVDSGFAAIEKVKEGEEYDIVFMDHMMPEMDGIEATKIIRGLGYSKSIVALTANAVAGQADIFLGNGFDDFISKPIDIRQLNVILNSHIRDKQPPGVVEEARKQADKKEVTKNDDTQTPVIDPKFAEIFVRDASKALVILEKIAAKNDYSDEDDLRNYIINVHGMKSALANMKKMNLSAVAMKLETAGREGKIDIIKAETAAFLDSLRAYADELTPRDAAAGDDKTEDDTGYLRDKLIVIKAACEDYDERAANQALSDLREKEWTKETKELLSRISEKLLHSDFDEVISLINNLIEKP